MAASPTKTQFLAFAMIAWMACLGFPAAAQPSSSSIPERILESLKVGGVNLVFDWYDTDKFNPHGFDAELPLIKAAGGAHVRLVISMDILEQGATGRLREDRWRELSGFVNRAREQGLVTIIDVHNTGLRGPDGNWSDDYMGRLGDPGMQARHLSLLGEVAARIFAELERDWVVLGPANEPQKDLWYAYQDRLMPVIRKACPDCVIMAMAAEWQTIPATMRHMRPSQRPWWDRRFIIDVHFYSPHSLTHCSYPGKPNDCPGKEWPGYYWGDSLPTGGRSVFQWNRQLLEREFQKLWNWQDANGGPLLHFAEIGTAVHLDDGPRSAYLRDLIDILSARGVGWTCYEWHSTFGIKNAPRTKDACLRGPRAAGG